MGDERIEGEMIEIGDPAEESTAPSAPPRVVIEYRDRGVPWMLIPPLLVLSAVAAVLAYPRLASPPIAHPAPRAVEALAAAPDFADDDPLPGPELPAPVNPEPRPVEPPTVPADSAVVPPTALVEPAPAPGPAPVDPAPFPRVPNLGFDPKALEVPRDPGPPVDQGLAPASVPTPRRDPIAERPAEVDPGLLPPDPKLARIRREQRVVEARQQAEADRGRFHAELRAICRKSGARSAPEIVKLCNRSTVEVDASVKQKAARLLGTAGSHEGASRAVRINLLRSLGFPETAILGDLMDHQRLWENVAARDGTVSQEEALYRAATLLLNYPPNRVATATRPVSQGRPGPGARPPSPVAPEPAQ